MAYQKIPFTPDYGGVTADDMNHIQTQYDEAAADLNAHKSANPIDHPDGSVTLAKLAASAMTSAGGTEPNRLARTNSNGRVGDSERLGGVLASSYARIASGSYVGDGTSNRFIAAGFDPRMVFVVGHGSTTESGVGLGIAGTPWGISKRAGTGSGDWGLTKGDDNRMVPEVVAGGFRVSHSSGYGSLNVSGVVYYWVAIG